jgi:hypothetical protein
MSASQLTGSRQTAGLTAALLTDLRHFTDAQGLDFQSAVSGGIRTWQRLSTEGPDAARSTP